MGLIRVERCPIEGLYIIEPAVHSDGRGFFMETYNRKDMHEAGLDMVFVQDSQSMSVKGVLRGLHFQKQASWCGSLKAGYLMLLSIYVPIAELSGNGLDWNLRKITKNSFIFLKALRTDSLC